MKIVWLMIEALILERKVSHMLKSKEFGTDYYYTKQVLALLEYQISLLKRIKNFLGNNGHTSNP